MTPIMTITGFKPTFKVPVPESWHRLAEILELLRVRMLLR